MHGRSFILGKAAVVEQETAEPKCRPSPSIHYNRLVSGIPFRFTTVAGSLLPFLT